MTSVVLYLGSSAAIAVLVLTFQLWRTMQNLESTATAIVPAIERQNALLTEIRNTIHEEASRKTTVPK